MPPRSEAGELARHAAHSGVCSKIVLAMQGTPTLLALIPEKSPVTFYYATACLFPDCYDTDHKSPGAARQIPVLHVTASHCLDTPLYPSVYLHELGRGWTVALFRPFSAQLQTRDMMSDEATLTTAVKVIHVFSGIYLWEYFTSLRFEWEVFTGKRPWRWSFAVYFISRTLALGSTLLSFIGFNLHHKFNCEAWFRSILAFSWYAIAFASCLLVLRAIAIWGRNPWIIGITVSVWFANFGSAAYSVTRGRTQWIPGAGACLIAGTVDFRWGMFVNVLEDTVLLVVMIIGVMKKRNTTDLWRLLYFQGLAWITSAALSEVPSVVMSFLNINDGWNLMFQVPHMVIIVTISTRVYRNLFQYIIGDTEDSTPYFKRRQEVRMRVHGDSDAVQVNVHKTVEIDVELNSITRHSTGDGDSQIKDGVTFQDDVRPRRSRDRLEMEERRMKEESYMGI
ncbi:hypothetical protein FA95DRAFT_1553737 [Auriscalpium vulgare]|uniref:Uncharacterized protein n=1 Tax=Auriscalpium vulgare TaxID=40419 RepID=A0ACB8S7Y8_9AGAM|nr:hypothetical protein FA95DRAFT_1553737 [Auriscalpium vulgare]